MTAPPKFGDAIEVNGERPSWLPDDVEIDWTWDAHYAADRDWNGTGTPASMVAIASGVSAIRLEVPRYDFVYLALERGMVPWFGQTETSPSDWDGISALQRCGNVVPWIGSWKHPWGGDPLYDAIGYTRKATSTALPLAHPAAPQGEDSEVERLREALEEISEAHLPDQPASDGGSEYEWAVRHIRQLRKVAFAALAPAAIASGREGA